jgi:hypothetical protein
MMGDFHRLSSPLQFDVTGAHLTASPASLSSGIEFVTSEFFLCYCYAMETTYGYTFEFRCLNMSSVNFNLNNLA